jgi:excisionase family DNA binding protein
MFEKVSIPDPAKLLLSIEDLVSILGCSRSTVYGLFRSGKLHAVQLGNRPMVRADELRRFLDALPTATINCGPVRRANAAEEVFAQN